MKTWFALFLLSCAALAAAQETPKLAGSVKVPLDLRPLGYVQEGVYFETLNPARGARTSILELKAGQFRYWLSISNRTEGASTTLQSGSYTTNGGTVTFVTSTRNTPSLTNTWTFMKYQGRVTLWTPQTVKFWKERSTILSSGILFSTDRKPEDILDGK